MNMKTFSMCTSTAKALLLLILGLGYSPVHGAVRYVSLQSPQPTPPYTTWETAAKNIQDAVDAAAAGDTILVTNGVYAAGGKVIFGGLTNRVALDKPVLL